MEKEFLSNCLMRLQTWQRIVLGVGKMEVCVRLAIDGGAFLSVALINGEEVSNWVISETYEEFSRIYMKEIENKLHDYGWY